MKRIHQLDAARGIAIIAVVLDHAFYLFPRFTNEIIWKHLYFSVPWFVFLSGVTSALSIRKHGWVFPKSIVEYWKRRWAIPVWYVCASIFIYLYDTKNMFEFREFYQKLLDFAVEPTYYFINLILQLYFIFPVLASVFMVVKSRFLRLITIPAAYILGEYLLMKMPAPWPFAPAGRIFGGLYFAVYVTGIVFGLENLLRKKSVILGSMVLFGLYEIYFLLTRGGFIGIVPNSTTLVWSLTLCIAVIGLLTVMDPKPVIRFLGFLGQQSLVIYLFHFFILRQFIAWPKNVPEFLIVSVIALAAGSLINPALVLLKNFVLSKKYV